MNSAKDEDFAFFQSIISSLDPDSLKGVDTSILKNMLKPATIYNEKFQKISISHDTTEDSTVIELVPIKYYICETPNSEIRAVLYKLYYEKMNYKDYRDITKTSEETEIFYYISDGNTNSLRANMLYPFWCLNDRQSEGEDCPYTYRSISDWGLFKLAIFKNLDLKIIDKIVFDKTVEDVRKIIKNMDIRNFYYRFSILESVFKDIYKTGITTFNKLLNVDPTKTRIVDLILDEIVKNELENLCYNGNYSQSVSVIDSNNPSMGMMTTGIRSVLRRVQNILDLLISFINENIINFDERNIDKYRPNYNMPREKYNMEIPGDFDSEHPKRPIFNIENSEYNIVEIFRKNLLNELKKIVSGIIDSGVVVCQEIALEPLMIDGSTFNKELKICTGSEGKYEEYFENKMKIYENISKNIHDIFLQKICLMNLQILKPLITNFEVFKLSDTTYSESIYVPQHSKCKQKYLKYKTKYLELKKKLIIK
jgi:hypothetical protein